MKHVERFLGEGNKVKLTIMFRGREMSHPELGLKILQRVAEEVREIAIVESSPRQDGRNMTMVLHPTKKPKTRPRAATPAAGNEQRDGRARPGSLAVMPKVKTHRGAAKRFKVTGTGQDPAPQGVPVHLLEKKSSRRTRRLGTRRRGHGRRQEARRAHARAAA